MTEMTGRLKKLDGVMWAAVVAGGLFAWGCSDSGGTIVTGAVTFAGKPLCGAGVRFYEPIKGIGMVASLNSSGEYETPTPLPPGNYQVSITGAPPASITAPDFIPKHYLNGSTSTLTADVSVVENAFDFKLSDKELKGRNGKAPRTPVVMPRAG